MDFELRLILGILALASGCAARAAPDLVIASATQTLKCSASELSIENVGASSYLVAGCGKQLAYACAPAAGGERRCFVYQAGGTCQRKRDSRRVSFM